MWPQIAIIVLMSVGLTIALIKDGEPRSNHSFWGAVIGVSINLCILYAGGFFDVLTK